MLDSTRTALSTAAIEHRDDGVDPHHRAVREVAELEPAQLLALLGGEGDHHELALHEGTAPRAERLERRGAELARLLVEPLIAAEGITPETADAFLADAVSVYRTVGINEVNRLFNEER